MNFKINISGSKELKQMLNEKKHLIKDSTTNARVLEGVGAILAAQGMENLEQGGTETLSYKLLKKETQRRKRKRGQSMQPLQGEGLLKQSLDYEVQSGNLYLTAVDYAKYHQEGGDIMPKRPIFSLETGNLKDIQYLILNHIKNG